MHEVDLSPVMPIDYETISSAYLNSTAPYEYIYSIVDPFDQATELNRLTDAGKAVGFNGVKGMFQNYIKSINKITNDGKQLTIFTGQPSELYTTWEADDFGVRKLIQQQTTFACAHPITISKRIHNIDSGLERLELCYRTGRRWRQVIVDKSTTASANKIVQLADYGISVSSENAKWLVNYLQELEASNYDAIPTVEATARLGWVTETEYMPYSENVEFDGDAAFSRLFHSVHQEGSRQVWVNAMSKVRRRHVAGRVAIAASMLSPMLKIIGAQPSFVHFWSSMSSTGKTLLIMCAASVWGDPELGDYTQSFNATTVAMERTAETLNTCPMVVDELQLSRDARGTQRFDVYKLAQGLGKGRGTKTGGIERTATWANTIITSGESPLVSESDGQGAFARVMDLQIEEILFDFESGNKLAKEIKSNYGWGGPEIVQAIKSLGTEEIGRRFDECVKRLVASDEVQDKQVALGAGLLLADAIADEFIFKDDVAALTLEELMPLLRSRDSTTVESRAYDFIQGWVAENSNKFQPDSLDFYGQIIDGRAYILKNKFDDALKNEGYNSQSVLSAFARSGLIETSKEKRATRYTVRRRFKNTIPHCVSLKLDQDEVTESAQTELPF